MRVLLVEDDGVLRGVLVERLRSEGFAVDQAQTLVGAEHALYAHDYDCLVLDRGLPDGDALDLVDRRDEVTRHRRPPGTRGASAPPSPDAPVLFLTARRELPARLAAFAAGADDYLTKPFEIDELVARVRALCRRRGQRSPSRCAWGDLVVDRSARTVERGGVLLTLTPKEFALLEALIDADGQVVAHQDLIERCWDDQADLFSNALYVHVTALRRKLGDPPVIRAVRGVGYALAVVPED